MNSVFDFLTLDSNSMYDQYDKALKEKAYHKVAFIGVIISPLLLSKETIGDAFVAAAQLAVILFRDCVSIVHLFAPKNTDLHLFTVYILSNSSNCLDDTILKIMRVAFRVILFSVLPLPVLLLASPFVFHYRRKKSVIVESINPHPTSPNSDESQNSIGFSSVTGMKEFKKKLNHVLKPILKPELAKIYKIPFPSGLIFYGKPGCGKSYMAKKFAEELGKSMKKTVSVTELRVENVKSPKMHETSRNLRKIFSIAAEEAKNNDSLSVLIIDELDTLIPKIDPNRPRIWNIEDRSEFLKVFESAAEQRVLFIGTTNHLHFIDKAILRPGRFDKLIKVPLPDAKACALILREKLSDLPLDQNEFNDQFYREYGRLCSENKLNIADIENICSSLKREYAYEKFQREDSQESSQAASSQQSSAGLVQIHLTEFVKKFEKLVHEKNTQQVCY